MADDSKRDNNVCVRVTDRMLLDINRLCALEDIKQSDYLYALIRRDLYGRKDKSDRAASEITKLAGED